MTDWFGYSVILMRYPKFTFYLAPKNTHSRKIISRLHLWESPKSNFACGESTERRNAD